MTRKYKIDGVTYNMKADEESARDVEDKEWADGEVTRNAKAEIHRLEATVTQRRIRAMTTDAGKQWMVNIEKLISDERSKL
tara:strand:+ start:212 stop:454 length:243 start_codon:yes stop_codon:yes gene_type:complete